MRWSSHALSVAKAPLDKNKYALGMRWPHSSLGIWIHVEHGLDLDTFRLESSLSDDCFPECEMVSQVCGLNPDSA